MPGATGQIPRVRARSLARLVGLWLVTSTLGVPAAHAANGYIGGTVTQTGGGALSGVFVNIYDSSGTYATFGLTDTTGQYTSNVDLPPGTYFARTWNPSGFINKLYDNLPCASCTVTDGTAIIVMSAMTTTGIDFVLTPGGLISGTVTGAGGTPLMSIDVSIYDASGAYVTDGFTDALGQYVTASGLPTGTYFAATMNSSSYMDELYDNLSCIGGFCTVTAGTPIAVTIGLTTSSVDFALVLGGTISGTVTNTGAVGLADVFVSIYDASGAYFTYGYTDAMGHYASTSGLPTGTYFARTSFATGYLNELYDNLPCVGSFCTVTTGTPIPVTLGLTTSGIDFELAAGGLISGTVTNTVATSLSGVTVYVYDATGAFVLGAPTNLTGQYITANGLPAGTYFARTFNAGLYLDELYDNQPCVSVCTVTSGTPIIVTSGMTTTGIDFVLSTFTDDPIVSGLTTVRAVHVMELRTRIDALRAAHVLAAFGWTDHPLVAGTTPVRAVHLTELRTALNQVYVAAATPTPTYTDPALTIGTTIKAVHLTELRAFVLALE